jgi:serine/threonine protein kinase
MSAGKAGASGTSNTLIMSANTDIMSLLSHGQCCIERFEGMGGCQMRAPAMRMRKPLVGPSSEALFEAAMMADRAARAVTHPGVVRIARRSFIDNTAGTSSIHEWRELCNEGEIMDAICNEGPALTWPQGPMLAVSWVEQVAAAVAHCHSHGIAHGQLRLESVLLHEGAPKIIGFERAEWREMKYGSSKCVESQSDSVGGEDSEGKESPATLLALRPPKRFDAPELKDLTHASLDTLKAADVWGLGVLLTSLLAGAPPSVASAAGLTGSECSTSPDASPLSPSVWVHLPFEDEGMEPPPELLSLIVCMLDARPSARPSAADVSVRLAEIMDRLTGMSGHEDASLLTSDETETSGRTKDVQMSSAKTGLKRGNDVETSSMGSRSSSGESSMGSRTLSSGEIISSAKTGLKKKAEDAELSPMGSRCSSGEIC